MNILTSIVMILFSMSCWVEKIDGPANVRNRPNGDVPFSFEHNVVLGR